MTAPQDDLPNLPNLIPVTDVPLCLSGRGLLDGCTSLWECGIVLRGYACHLEALAHAGWALKQPVADDLGELVRTPFTTFS
jgi:hypothetical protein